MVMMMNKKLIQFKDFKAKIISEGTNIGGQVKE